VKGEIKMKESLVKRARMRSGMQGQQAAAAAYVNKGTQSKYESGANVPRNVIKLWYNTPMGRTKEFYELLCSRCEIGMLDICDGKQCPVGIALDRRQKVYEDLKIA
jgi:transcriptional regulator with XRE-family HTH domain